MKAPYSVAMKAGAKAALRAGHSAAMTVHTMDASTADHWADGSAHQSDAQTVARKAATKDPRLVETKAESSGLMSVAMWVCT